MSHFPTIFKTRQATIEALSASGTPLTLKAFTGQTARLLTFTDSSDVVTGGLTSDNALFSYGSNAGGVFTDNLAFGENALSSFNLGAGKNIAIGKGAMAAGLSNTNSIAIGFGAMPLMTGNGANIAIGTGALPNATFVSGNVAIGSSACGGNWQYSVGVGHSAMAAGEFESVAMGHTALVNGTGGRTVSIGYQSGHSKASGNYNIYLGYRAGYAAATNTQSSNIFLGAFSGNNVGNNANTNICIGYNVQLPQPTVSNQLNIANAIYGHDLGGSNPKISIGYQETNASYRFGVQGGFRVRTTGGVDSLTYNANSGIFNIQGFIQFRSGGPSYISTGSFALGTSTTKAGRSLVLSPGINGAPVNWNTSGTPNTPLSGDHWYTGTDMKLHDGTTERLFSFTNIVEGNTKQHYFAEGTLTDGANIAWNLDDNQSATVTLEGNRTLDNPTNMKAGAVYYLRVDQGVVGNRTLAYGTAYEFRGGGTPALSTAANAVDIFRFYCDGTTMYGELQGTGTPAGVLNSIQVNSPLGGFNGSNRFLWDDANRTLSISTDGLLETYKIELGSDPGLSILGGGLIERSGSNLFIGGISVGNKTGLLISGNTAGSGNRIIKPLSDAGGTIDFGTSGGGGRWGIGYFTSIDSGSLYGSTTLTVGGIGLDSSTLASFNSTTQGVRMPRMTTTERDAIGTPATSLRVYNTTTNQHEYYDGSAWVGMEVVTNTAKTDAVNNFSKQQYSGETTLTDAANISWDLDDNQNTAVTLTASRTLDNPTNMKAGATYVIRFIQGGTGSYGITFGSAYVTANDSTAAFTKTLSTAVGSYTTVRFYCDGTNMIAI